MPILADVFASNQENLKFEVLRLSVGILSSWRAPAEFASSQTLWPEKIRGGLKDVFGSKIAMEHRDLALVLSSIMLRIFGVQWVFGDASDIKGKGRAIGASTLSSAQFGTLLIHIACAETRVLLDDLPQRDVFDDTGRAAHMLPVCYEILESAIAFLVGIEEGGGESGGVRINVPPQMLLSVRGALRETFLAVGAFLVDRLARYQATGNFAVIDNIITAFSLRALATFLGEETEIPAKEICEIVPLLVIASRQRLSSLDVHPLDFLTPSLTNITADDTTRPSFIDNGGCDAVIDYFVTLDASSGLMVASAGVLLNVVVSSGAVVKGNERFVEMLKKVERGLGAEVSQTPHLFATLVALFVFTLRGLDASQRSHLGSNTLSSLFDSTLRFVCQAWDWHASRRDVWEQVSELWFLTNNVLASCLTEVEGVPDALSRSQQLPVVLKMGKDLENMPEDERMCLKNLISAVFRTVPKQTHMAMGQPH
ncbi:hypothetical protein HK104_003053 [Borealophlyctis nickersoniae]|nr:hypothetical protein HK104_003053 [Borealophlyctis nickersoniae]